MMRIYRFRNDGNIYWGTSSGPDLSSLKYIDGSVYEDWEIGGNVQTKSDFRILPPFEGNKIVGLAYNYKDLVGFSASYQEPLVFLKSTDTVINSGDSIQFPQGIEKIDKVWVEVELALVVKKPLYRPNLVDLNDAILGVTIANDVTANNVDNRDHHLARSKSLPTFCPIGDYLLPNLDTNNLQMSTKINGVTTQSSNTKNRILNDYDSLLFVSHLIPLFPGDLILTGTPKGAQDSLINPGDDVKLEIENIGVLNNMII